MSSTTSSRTSSADRQSAGGRAGCRRAGQGRHAAHRARIQPLRNGVRAAAGKQDASRQDPHFHARTPNCLLPGIRRSEPRSRWLEQTGGGECCSRAWHLRAGGKCRSRALRRIRRPGRRIRGIRPAAAGQAGGFHRRCRKWWRRRSAWSRTKSASRTIGSAPGRPACPMPRYRCAGSRKPEKCA